jgi:pyridinium-3,5-biscarboxylic acid mononucleotide sulfurtransferase
VNTEDKLRKLKTILKKTGSVIVSFSGGTDSTFLIKCAVDTLGKENVLAVNAVSPLYPAEEKREAEKISSSLGVKHIKIKTGICKNPDFMRNNPDRCFTCKKKLFAELEEIRKNYNLKTIIDGTNKDDEKYYRPGEKAKKYYSVLSPLQKAGLTKKEIRRLSSFFNLPTFEKPADSCLATRIPYGEKITVQKLKRIEKGEKKLKEMGFKIIRLREYNAAARIEIEQKEMKKALEYRKKISEELRKLGYTYITLDLEGYRSGSMDEK